MSIRPRIMFSERKGCSLYALYTHPINDIGNVSCADFVCLLYITVAICPFFQKI
jgi:hypothetical protein